MFIQQISVFLENRTGTMRELMGLLGSENIDVRELSVADTQAFGIVRMILRSDAIEKTLAVLKREGYTARVNHVICAEIEDKPNGLCNLLSIIEEENLSVEYIYSFRRATAKSVAMVLRLSEPERGCKVLKARGVRIIEQEEVDQY